MDTYVIIAAAAIAIGVIIAVLRSPGFFKKFLGSAALGLAGLGIVNVTSAFTGVTLALSWCNIIACAVLGLPGVISLLAIKAVFGI